MNIFNLTKKSHFKNFFLLWFGQSLSSFGSSMTSFALIIWVYKSTNTAMSAMLLSVFTYLPYVLVSFLAGAVIDKFSNKKILFFCDCIAALCTLCVFILLLAGKLESYHLYLINFVSGFMNAFQDPASKVTYTKIISKKYYAKINGLQSLSDSLNKILTPILATFILSLFGINMIFIVDLLTFVVAVVTLVFLIDIPNLKSNDEDIVKKSVIAETIEGFNFLKTNKSLLYMIFFMSGVNLIGFMVYLGILPIMILARTSNNEQILAIVTSAGGIGAIIGGGIVTIVKPPKKLIKMTFTMCAVFFMISDMMLAIGNNVVIWSLATFIGDLPIPFVKAYQNSFVQLNVPTAMQGRIFSIQGTLQRITIPIGYFMGGYLADKVFEPLMKNSQKAQCLFKYVVGTGNGSGMAIMFICSSILSCLISLMACRNKYIKKI